MNRWGHEPDDTQDVCVDRCRQCGRDIAVRADEDRADGPYTCDECVRSTVNRAARPSRFSDYLFDCAADMARMRR